jgi:hypothetical protein
VGFKKKFGESIGIGVEIFGQDNETNFEHLAEQKKLANNKQLTAKNVIELIHFLNTDPACV